MVAVNGNFKYSAISTIKDAATNKFSIFPNPAINYIGVTITSSPLPTIVKLVNQSGQVLQQKNINSTSVSFVTLTVKGYPKGIYYVQVIHADGTIQAKQVLIAN